MKGIRIMYKIPRRIVTLAVPLVLLAGCGTGEPQDAATAASESATATATPAPSQDATGDPASSDGGVDEVGDEGPVAILPPGPYTGTSKAGGMLLATIPTDAPDDVRAYAEEVQADPIGAVKLDFSGGGSDMGVQSMTVVDPDGKELEYIPVGAWAEEHGPTMNNETGTSTYTYTLPDGREVTEDDYDRLDDAGVALGEAYPSESAPMAAGSTILVGPALPDGYLYVEVTLSGMETVPLEHNPAAAS